jgi:hypothetical protein
MPYILPHLRAPLDPTSDTWSEGNNAPRPAVRSAANAGELNYQIAKLVQRFIDDRGGNYGAINEAIGALECCKLEVYRRIAAPYESTKLAENGDVFT